jgi:Sulfotransferase family
MKVDNRRPVFVIGSPRSGTTFLMRVFQASSETTCISGVIFPPTLCWLANKAPDRLRVQLASVLRHSISNYLQSSMHVARAPRLQKWWAASRNPFELRGFLKSGTTLPLVVYKEPFLSFCPELILEAFPTARVIHIVRDGRDSADSLTRTYNILTDDYLADPDHVETATSREVKGRRIPDWVPESDEGQFLDGSPFLRSVTMWREMVSRCEHLVSTLADRNPVLEIRYEDLMEDPQKVFESVAAFAGITMSRRVRRVLSTAHLGSIGIHRRREADQCAQATLVAKEMLERYNYV